MSKMKVVCLFSGGLDSTALLAYQQALDRKAVALSVNYGQRHRIELESAKEIAKCMEVEHVIVNLPGLAVVMKGSSQTDTSVAVPHGHYAADNMKTTVVPNRNMILLSIAAAYAISHKCPMVAYAAHLGDHTIYPDCRPEFASVMGQALHLCDWDHVYLQKPFIKMTKAEIVTIGVKHGAPLHKTWSCYEGGYRHCGKCGTCVERKEAFELAGVKDPTEYEG